MMYRGRWFTGLAYGSLLAFAQGAAADQVKIAVAANFTDVAKQLAPLFKSATGHDAVISFGSTGKLYSQIENGAPFEVFLAADTKRPAKAENEGLAVKGSLFTYALGKLVLWSETPNLFGDAEQYLKAATFDRLAIANPKTAPYGLAAQQVLTHLNIYASIKPKLVMGDSIAQTFQFAATGNAQAAFVAYSQVKAWQHKGGSEWLVPDSYYAPIAQAAVLLKKGEANPAAGAFMAFLKSDAAHKVILDYGYGLQ